MTATTMQAEEVCIAAGGINVDLAVLETARMQFAALIPCCFSFSHNL